MDWSKIIEMATLIIAIVGCCISFYYLGYLKGSEAEKESQWLSQSSLQDLIRYTRKTVTELRIKILEYELKQGNNIKQNNEQQ